MKETLNSAINPVENPILVNDKTISPDADILEKKYLESRQRIIDQLFAQKKLSEEDFRRYF